MTEDKYTGFYNGKNIQSYIGYRPKNNNVANVIDKIWLTGQMALKDGATAELWLNILLIDGSKNEFVSDDLQKVTLDDLLKQADEWIDKLTNPNI